MISLPASAATFIGGTISEQYYYPDLATPYAQASYIPQSFTVGAGQESVVWIENVTSIGVDFSAAALDLDFTTSLDNPTFGVQPFNGLVFTSAAFAQFNGVTISGMTNLSGFDASRVTLSGNELRLDWGGLTYNSDTVIELNFSSAVPEPALWMLLIIGFAAVGISLRKDQAGTAAIS
ncbi:PEP-CTERM sorting domain-containing protein [Sphingomonas quercus]|uniref:PEP-CTERM protein-sorting domain-containing protein n=1 Tax=Sphingomonas quercus TaxID=2842451 RepID=A0ABS6BDE9_9SPHN|nr:PEP-CTERM sorting domain-containing protein [Sphingomonas quercus]MBU3076337.1 hypothetical protein [Sphingomonas quercus]